MDAICRPLKIYFLPFYARGHLIPFFQFARLFAARGLHVTIITTPLNAKFLEKSIGEDQTSGRRVIHIHTVRFPSDEVGLTNSTENFSDATDNQTAAKLIKAVAFLRPEVEHFVEQNPPDCIVSDFIFTWSSDLATRLGIPRIVFNSFCLFAVCMIDAVKRCYNDRDESFDCPFVVPGLPHPIALTLRPQRDYFRGLEALLEAELNSCGLIVNNFAELDGEEYIQHYKKTTGHKVWHIGPASLMLRKESEEMNVSGYQYDEHERIRSWLDSREPGSVVYVSFGSMCRFPDQQLFEIASGLESSGHKFIWVVHRNEESEGNGKKGWLPEGFEERMKKEKRGWILTGWAPQVIILNHPAIGGFFTHCGWTSVTEGISAGVPMMTWPVFAEQFYNEKLITQVHGFGVEVGAEEWMMIHFDHMEKVVRREKIEKAMRRLMDDGEEGRQVRKKAREMGEKARKAVEEGGSSQKNLSALIEELRSLALNRAPN